MPKITRSVPSYRLHKASGQAVVTLDGRDHYLGRHGTSESNEEYDRLIAEWLPGRRQETKTDQVDGDALVNELIDVYMDFVVTYYVKNGKPTGEQQAIKYSLRPLSELYGDSVVNKVGPGALRAVREKMIDQNLCRKLINARANRIRRMFKWAVEHEYADPRILEGLRAVAPLKRGRSGVRESDPVTPVTEEAMLAVKAFVSRQVWAMIQLQWLTGMRPCEVTIMRGADIDRSQETWVYCPAHHKTEHHGIERKIFLGPESQKIVTSFLKTDPEAFLFSPLDAKEEHLAKRRRERQTPMTPSQVKRRRKRKPKRASHRR